MVVIDLQTRQCPFCAEMIQAQAIKCRFCDEFLNSGRAKALEAKSESNLQSSEAERANDNVLFEGRPSLWGMSGAVIKGLFFIVVAGLLVKLPLEHLLGLKL
ncbi:hypothetical protein KAU11_12685, partial [Candidatus Babeliales bacterium]|nr:hypothetical protein [Candidatus Babeliales bacterium]